MQNGKLVCLSTFDGIATGKQYFEELGIDCIYYSSEIDEYSSAIAKI